MGGITMTDDIEFLLKEILLELQEVNSNLSGLDSKVWSIEYDVDQIRDKIDDLSFGNDS